MIGIDDYDTKRGVWALSFVALFICAHPDCLRSSDDRRVSQDGRARDNV